MEMTTTHEESDPTYDPLDNRGMCAVFAGVVGFWAIVIILLVIYAN
jgi:hypothetical protein